MSSTVARVVIPNLCPDDLFHVNDSDNEPFASGSSFQVFRATCTRTGVAVALRQSDIVVPTYRVRAAAQEEVSGMIRLGELGVAPKVLGFGFCQMLPTLYKEGYFWQAIELVWPGRVDLLARYGATAPESFDAEEEESFRRQKDLLNIHDSDSDSNGDNDEEEESFRRQKDLLNIHDSDSDSNGDNDEAEESFRRQKDLLNIHDSDSDSNGDNNLMGGDKGRKRGAGHGRTKHDRNKITHAISTRTRSKTGRIKTGRIKSGRAKNAAAHLRTQGQQIGKLGKGHHHPLPGGRAAFAVRRSHRPRRSDRKRLHASQVQQCSCCSS